MEKMDRKQWIAAAEALVPLTDPAVLAQLKAYPDTGDVRVAGVSGHVIAKINTPAGAIVIGSKEPARYDLDALGDVAAVVAQGSDNRFYEGTTSLERPVLVVLSLGGHNVYQATKPGVQGGAILGVSMLLNLEGGNRYEAQDVAQGSALAGVGILLDYGGKNVYRGLSAGCRGTPWAAWACWSAAAARTISTPPCGPKATAPRWASGCWTIWAATIIIIAAASTRTPTSPKPPVTKGTGKASAPASGKWATAGSACC